ncbi:hypothetical protein ACWDVX_22750 [Streptomyces tendae]
MTDQTALRDRIARVLWPLTDWDGDELNAERAADAVLAVLPATTNHDTDTGAGPVCKDAEGCHRVVPCNPGCGTRDLRTEATRPQPANVDRAAILREEADRIDATRADFPIAVQNGITWATAELRRVADETAATETQAAPVQHAPGKAILCPDCRTKGYIVCQDDPTADPWRGATEVISDREVERLAATGLVGYRQGRGRLLHCLHHKPVPASRWADFHEVTSDDLPDGGICVHPRCGADLLAVQPAAGARQDGAQR